MFLIVTTKPLNDGTKGFRFNLLGQKGLVRLRKHKSNGWFKRVSKGCMITLHMGRLSVYAEHKSTKKKLFHFAG